MVRSPFLQRGVSYELFGGCGPGEWLAESTPQGRLGPGESSISGVDAGTGQIIAFELTSKDVDDGLQVGPLLEQIAGPVALTGGEAAPLDQPWRASHRSGHDDAKALL